MTDEKEYARLLNIIRDDSSITYEANEDVVRRLIAETVFKETREKKVSLEDREKYSKKIFDSIRKMDIIQELIDDDEVTEIMINGYDHIFIEKKGVIYEWNKKFVSNKKLDDLIQQIVSACNRTVNESEPIVDARLSDGSRVNITLSPPALHGSIVTIRRFSSEIFTMDKLIELGSISREAADYLERLIVAGYSIFVSGSTSSGKTTLLNVLSECIPKNERVITIEDSAELRINGIPNLVQLETRNANSSGCGEITIRDLIKNALRQRPDRLIIGEVRGAEVADMLQAFNTGHEGSMSTGHANSCEDMITRLEAMYLQSAQIPLEAIKRQIASGIDIMVHLERSRDGKRRISEITELGSEEDKSLVLNRIFETVMCDGEYVLKKTGELKNILKLKRQEVV